eukprot:14959262-Alexandrium_andersonii.AAC.1
MPHRSAAVPVFLIAPGVGSSLRGGPNCASHRCCATRARSGKVASARGRATSLGDAVRHSWAK